MKLVKYSLIFLVALLASCMFAVFMPIACKSGPGAQAEILSGQVPETDGAASGGQEAGFNAASISKELYDATISEVQNFIGLLNIIISKKDYAGWKSNLSEEYFKKISSPDYLREASEQPAMKLQKITLRSPQDYFNNVVVPSRANSHVDDIEFVSENIVKVFTVSPKNERLRLYELEKTGNTWMIIN
ncbi:MAG: hypothetical protein LBH43_07195 [Treponema sp.]|nr:hypothetical protein [Treponema sp.]